MFPVDNASPVRIIPFEDRYAAEFARLNYEWIAQYFEIEPHDRELLDHPSREIVDRGGQVFLALTGEVVAGTVAMIRFDDETFEVSKMAVSSQFRGKGIANLLMHACISFAMSHDAKTVFLETNSILVTAISLYRKFGFIETPLDPESLYSRANVRMELAISNFRM